MPELPEVETIKNDLAEALLGQEITKVHVGLARMVLGEVSVFKQSLLGRRFQAIDRVGKLLVISLDSPDRFLLVHLKMTGQLIYSQAGQVIAGGHSLPQAPAQLPGKYTHIYFRFEDGAHLFFNDMRTFGYMRLVDGDELALVKLKFGYEPLSQKFTARAFGGLLRGKKGNIKAFLLNQLYVAGIGNIYADEILFRAGVLPMRSADTLSAAEVSRIYQAIKPVLRAAIKYRGTTFNDYRDARGRQGNFVNKLQVFGRQGTECRKCGIMIEKNKTAGRGTHFCPSCQR